MEKNEALLLVCTDDEMFMQSNLNATVDKNLNVIEFEYSDQRHIRSTLFYVYPGQIDDIIKFLEESKAYMDSGFVERLKPKQRIV